MFDILDLYQAKSVDDAIEALSRDPRALLIAGGTDLLLKIRAGEYAERRLVSIHALDELIGIESLPDGSLVIKACTSFSAIAASPRIRQALPALAEAADLVGGPQIRHVATIGGNLCNGAASADSAPLLLVYNAIVELKDESGAVEAALRDFYTGPGKTIRKPSHILTAIKIRKTDAEGLSAHYIKFGIRNTMEIAALSCAAGVRLSGDRRTIEELRLAFGVAAPTPLRCPHTEREATGAPLSAKTLERIGEGALGELSPRDSWRASKTFRRQLIRELSGRAVRAAAEKAGGVFDAEDH